MIKTNESKVTVRQKDLSASGRNNIDWSGIQIKKLEPDVVFKQEKPSKTLSRQVVVKSTSKVKREQEKPLQTTSGKVEVLDTKKAKVRSNSSKVTDYGSERLQSYDDFSYFIDDDEEVAEVHHTIKSKQGLKVLFLGGIGEIGKNMTALEYGDEIIIIDAGSSFPDDNQLGVDLVVPDITYLADNYSMVKGICLTHGHEDHIGALPYIVEKINVPIYGSRLTLALVKNKLEEKGISENNMPKLICVEDDNFAEVKKTKTEHIRTFNIGKNFKVEFIDVCHSIAGSKALYIQTPSVSLIHTGDFKIDFTPVANVKTDLTRIAELGQKGVDLLLCESTNIDRKGFSMSESSIAQTFENIFIKNIKQRIIVATFASNISRLQQILSLCEKYNRKVIFTGRSMVNVTDIASSPEINALKFNKKIIVDINNIGDYKDEELLILCTGSQGEYRSALTRMAINDFPKITLGKNDVVIISASPIPGNEKSINNTINNLYKVGAEVIYSELADVHVSGHACQEEIKMMHTLVKPKFFIPVHGEYRHLRHHKDLALTLGMKEENIVVAENGACIKVTKNGIKYFDTIPSGVMFVDGLGIGDSDSSVIKERYILANEGICIVTICISRITCNLTLEPEIVTRGLIYREESSALILEAKQLLKEKINSHNYSRYDSMKIKNDIKKELQKFFVKSINRKPMIVAVLIENLSKN